MVDVSGKRRSSRVARAEGYVSMQRTTLDALQSGETPKGNVLTTAKIAGIQAAKGTAHIIPLCHPLDLSWVEMEFTLQQDRIRIDSEVKTKDATGVEMEALTAVSVAALTIYDMCKAMDKKMTITGIRLLEKKGGKSDYPTDYRPRVGIIVISDTVHAGKSDDVSGDILKVEFRGSGCQVDHSAILPDGSEDLEETIGSWIDKGAELIITSGGTGVGPRDLTIPVVEKLFDSRLPGVEQALHAYGRTRVGTAMLSRLAAGTVKSALVICLPGSPGAARDALKVLIPSIFHAYPVMEGKGHAGLESD